MKCRRRRKCSNCGRLYEPDSRNRRHQRCCSAPACRKASKAASQRRWRASPQGQDYFRGPVNVLRVQLWRKANPGYGNNHHRKPRALQDHCALNVLVPPDDKPTLSPRALQDLLVTQGLVLTGLVAQLTGSPLQEDMALAIQQLIALGQQMQGHGKQ